jgi:TonB family protein
MYARFCVSWESRNLRSLYRSCSYVFLPTVIIVISAVAALGQSTGTSEDVPPVNPAVARIERARALAAAHQLQTASAELENIRASVNDVALKNVSTLMLIGVYLEEGNYGRAQALLEEAFKDRAALKDESIRTYFAAAGQTVNGVRAHLARYRSFGLNPTEAELPPEANADLDRVRNLLERVIAQAKEIAQEAGRSYDALALQEDVLGIRLSLAHTNEDREKWQAEYVAAREKMASSKTQIASIGRSPALDAMTAKIPNPFASGKPAEPVPTETGTTGEPAGAAATTANDSAQPKLISAGSLAGRETKRVTPLYPSMARNTNIQGTVRVFAIVDENGKVWVTNSEGPTMLRRAAEDAARSWIFPPTLVTGKPVRVAGYLDFEFKL